MAVQVESAWPRYPDYYIDLVPCPDRGQVWAGDVLVAESDACLFVLEKDHVPRLYFPEADVRWEYFEATDHHSVCPFKGQADYWSLTFPGAAPADTGDNIVWTYRTPFPQVAGIEGHVCFYHEKLRVVLVETWPDGTEVPTRFPAWGDQAELVRVMDVQPLDAVTYQGPAHGDSARPVVEGGQIIGSAIVAAAKAVPGQRVTSATMIFSRAAMATDPIYFQVDAVRRGRSFSTLEVRAGQDGSVRSAGILLTAADRPDLVHDAAAMPAVDGPEQSERCDFGVTGRDLRVVGGVYGPEPDRTGPPEIHVWCRFRDAPAEPYLHAALLAQSTTHWTIAAAMLPHPGIGQADAHVSLSTGILQATLSLHDDVDVTEWLLYSNTAIWSGRGLTQGDGRVWSRDGRLVASYSVQSMIRPFDARTDPARIDHDYRRAM
ncbi:MAG TPA: DUF427 domain-containing protein [Acidimicrobiales bacterium]|nr:DUF427 domain-containing protein [Acidimicrobiales bacterium]